MMNTINRILLTLDIIVIISTLFSIIAVNKFYNEDVDAFVEDPKNNWVTRIVGYGCILLVLSIIYWSVRLFLFGRF